MRDARRTQAYGERTGSGSRGLSFRPIRTLELWLAEALAGRFRAAVGRPKSDARLGLLLIYVFDPLRSSIALSASGLLHRAPTLGSIAVHGIQQRFLECFRNGGASSAHCHDL